MNNNDQCRERRLQNSPIWQIVYKSSVWPYFHCFGLISYFEINQIKNEIPKMMFLYKTRSGSCALQNDLLFVFIFLYLKPLFMSGGTVMV